MSKRAREGIRGWVWGRRRRRGTHLSRSWSELAVRVLKYMLWRELRGPGGLSSTTARENCTRLEVKIR